MKNLCDLSRLSHRHWSLLLNAGRGWENKRKDYFCDSAWSHACISILTFQVPLSGGVSPRLWTKNDDDDGSDDDGDEVVAKGVS